MNNPVRAIVIMIKVMIAVAILLIIAGFTIGCVNKAKAADIKLLKTQHVDYEILFKDLYNEIKAYGYYLTKADGTKILLVVNPEGGVIEIQR
jgi:hypothetical protein